MRTTLLMLPSTTLRQMRDACESHRPNEACGMLVGRLGASGASVHRIVPLANVWAVAAERPTRYAIDPLEQLRAERQARADGLEVVGFYHSHPAGTPVPSGVDVDLAWPGYCYVIIGLTPLPEARAWTLNDDGQGFSEIRIEPAD